MISYVGINLTKQCSSEGIDLTAKGSPHPAILYKSINDHREAHRGHHAQIGEGQVDNEHVGLKWLQKNNMYFLISYFWSIIGQPLNT